MSIDKVRNFTIIAHIDHGKSTLADKFIRKAYKATHNEQSIDDMELEQERGITIKAKARRLVIDGYVLNLIDTPGHVDFGYEVSKSLLSCDTSILLVSAIKGVEAQTIANFHKAIDAGHFIIPVINKIDSQNANIEETTLQLMDLGFGENEILRISAHTGEGVDDLIQYIIQHAPPPKNLNNGVQAMVIDSWYDKYVGVTSLICLKSGHIKKGAYYIGSSKLEIKCTDIGYFTPFKQSTEVMHAGDIGYIVTQIKDPLLLSVGDTIVDSLTTPVLDGFKKVVPLVFCNIYPENADDAVKIKLAMEKYSINDAGFSFYIRNSDIYGVVFYCGFLGILHMETVVERLHREFDVDVIPSLPSVTYIIEQDGNQIQINNANDWPTDKNIALEPEVKCTILIQPDYIGKITNLCIQKRGLNIEMHSSGNAVIMECHMPLMEVISDFSDKLQSISNGYSSYFYEYVGHRESKLFKLLILINDEEIKELSTIVHESNAIAIGTKLVTGLKNFLPREQIKIKIQAALNTKSNIIAREDIQPYRKEVTSRCNGGDVTRRMKLLEKQKRGKKKMLKYGKIGKIDITSDTIRKLLT